MKIPHLVEPILEKLELAQPPSIDLAGLSQVYGRWCRKVPFDNLQKRLFYSGDSSGPLPGHNSEDFFKSWLAHGTGGTCWAHGHALHDLLTELGFAAVRCSATMLVHPDVVGPTHGTVIVTLEGQQYLVDGSIQTEEPVPLAEGNYGNGHPSSRIHLERRNGQWFWLWHPPHQIDGLWCRLERIDVPIADFDQYHEGTRVRSFFNSAVYIRLNQNEGTNALVFGDRIKVDANYQAHQEPLPNGKRAEVLIGEFGISEELATQLPADEAPNR